MNLPDLPDFPVIESAPAPLPDRLSQLADESVARFRSQFPAYLRPVAESQGWVEQYRAEVERVIREVQVIAVEEYLACLEQLRK